MKTPKILLLGRNGQVGWELHRTLSPLGNVVALDFPEIDFTNTQSLRQAVSTHDPEVIINAAAYTAVDKAENEGDRCHQVNSTAPAVLSEAAKKSNALIVHYSTDYVFDGSKRTPYTETDPANPLGAYGRSKLHGDHAVVSSGADHLIFRLCWVYGARGQNFMLTMQRLAREREALRVVSDQFGCPTWSRMIAEATTLALFKVLRSGDLASYNGCYHLAATGNASWHAFAQRIVDLMPATGRKCVKVEAISTAEYPTPARRPAYSVLNCDKLEQTFGLRLPDWETSLKQVLEPS
jgi:dTDP-4-dehydrorhamnose reductase